jgi:hypothetical protein
MADFQDLQTIANDAAFRGRCYYALTVEAVTTLQNSASNAQEVAYANAVLAGNVSQYEVALTILTNATIAAEATVASLPGCTAVPDSDIQFAADSLFSVLAGVQTVQV